MCCNVYLLGTTIYHLDEQLQNELMVMHFYKQFFWEERVITLWHRPLTRPKSHFDLFLTHSDPMPLTFFLIEPENSFRFMSEMI